MKHVIVVPTYNEKENIADFITALFSAVPDTHVHVVDDSSPDGTADIVRGLLAAYPNLSLHVRPEKTGLGSAYLEAFARLLGDREVATITTMDADFSHNPKYLAAMRAKVAEGADVVVGSRYIRGGGVPKWEPWRRFLSWGGNVYARIVTGVPVHDLTAGFVTFTRGALERLRFEHIHSAGYAYTIESKSHAHLAGARIAEVPIVFDERRGGESKISGNIVREGLRAPWRVRLYRLQGPRAKRHD